MLNPLLSGSTDDEYYNFLYDSLDWDNKAISLYQVNDEKEDSDSESLVIVKSNDRIEFKTNHSNKISFKASGSSRRLNKKLEPIKFRSTQYIEASLLTTLDLSAMIDLECILRLTPFERPLNSSKNKQNSKKSNTKFKSKLFASKSVNQLHSKQSSFHQSSSYIDPSKEIFQHSLSIDQISLNHTNTKELISPIFLTNNEFDDSTTHLDNSTDYPLQYQITKNAKPIETISSMVTKSGLNPSPSKPFSKRFRYGEYNLLESMLISRRLEAAERYAKDLRDKWHYKEEEFNRRLSEERVKFAERMKVKELEKEIVFCEATTHSRKTWRDHRTSQSLELEQQMKLKALEEKSQLLAEKEEKKMRLALEQKINEIREGDMRLAEAYKKKEEDARERQIISHELFHMRREDLRSAQYEEIRKEKDRYINYLFY
jgi:hypothetical protein